jgi:hypothetical protein
MGSKIYMRTTLEGLLRHGQCCLRLLQPGLKSLHLPLAEFMSGFFLPTPEVPPCTSGSRPACPPTPYPPPPLGVGILTHPGPKIYPLPYKWFQKKTFRGPAGPGRTHPDTPVGWGTWVYPFPLKKKPGSCFELCSCHSAASYKHKFYYKQKYRTDCFRGRWIIPPRTFPHS